MKTDENRKTVSNHNRQKFKVGDLVYPLIGYYSGHLCKVEKVDFDSGAINGWITVSSKANGQFTALLFAGEELILAKSSEGTP